MIPLPTSRGQTRAIVRLQGACPSCGDTVPRRITQTAGRIEETYVCPSHGQYLYVSGARTSFNQSEPGAAADLPATHERILASHGTGSLRPALHDIPIIA